MNDESNGARNSFWRITISGVAQIILLLIAIIGFSVTYDRSINDAKNLGLQNAHDIANLTKIVSDMNERGTNYSRSGLPLETSAIANLADRTNQHDKVLSELVPKIERLQTTLEFLSDNLHERKADKK